MIAVPVVPLILVLTTLIWCDAKYLVRIRTVTPFRCAIPAAILVIGSIAGFWVSLIAQFLPTSLAAVVFAVTLLAAAACACWFVVKVFDVSVRKAVLVLFPALFILLTNFALIPPLIAHAESAEARVRVRCAVNLKETYNSLWLYAGQDGHLLANLYVLVKEDYVSNDAFLCPAVKEHGRCDYFYFSWDRYVADATVSTQPARQLLKLTDDSRKILACDYRDNHNGEGRNIVFLDGHTEWLPEQYFQTLLKKPENTKFAKALRAAEGR